MKSFGVCPPAKCEAEGESPKLAGQEVFVPDANCARMQEAPTGLFDDPASSGALECDFSEYRLQNVPFSASSWADYCFADCGRTLILPQAFPLGILDTLDMPAAESVGGEELKSRLKTSLAAATELPGPMRPAIFGLDQASNSVLPTAPKAADNQQNQGMRGWQGSGRLPSLHHATAAFHTDSAAFRWDECRSLQTFRMGEERFGQCPRRLCEQPELLFVPVRSPSEDRPEPKSFGLMRSGWMNIVPGN